MPIYEYRCDNGHLFEVMQRMTDEPVTECQVCGAPVAARVPPDRGALQGVGLLQHGLRHGQAQARDSTSPRSDGADKHDAKQKDKKAPRRPRTPPARPRQLLGSGSTSSLRVVRLEPGISAAYARLAGIVIGADGRAAATLESMAPRQVGLLAALSAIWGGSYLLIKYALEDLRAPVIVLGPLRRRLRSSCSSRCARRAAHGGVADVRAPAAHGASCSARSPSRCRSR